MSPRAGSAGPHTLAFVESPVQLLNVPGVGATRRERAPATGAAPGARGSPLVVLSPTDPMTRGQLRRMAELARDEGITVRWEEARGGPARAVPAPSAGWPGCCAGRTASSSATRSPATSSCC